MMPLAIGQSKVLCSGILVADIFVPPMAALPGAGELRATEDFLLDTGGCAANVATGLARLGVSCAVNGLVGSDVFGDFVANDLRSKGVDIFGIRRSASASTSKTVILPVVGEDRRFIHTFGANAEFTCDDIALNALAPGSIFYLGGFLIMPALDAGKVADQFRIARGQGVTTVLDVVVPVGSGESSMRLLEQILPHTDYFLPNDEEAHALTGESDPLQQAKRFLAAGCGTALITQGKGGTLLLSETEHYEAGVFPIDFVDGSGSGDAFTAGFITGLAEQWDMAETLRFASAIGASACTKLGCTTGVFTRTEAERFLQNCTIEIKRGR
jgi:sugar/nucleoside kinase (ribokinase family)